MTHSFLTIQKQLMINKIKAKKLLKIKHISTFTIFFFIIERCFKFLLSKLFSMITINTFIISAKSLTFSKKLDINLKIICDVYHDAFKSHFVKEREKKKATSKWVFLSFEKEKKSMHFSKKFDEISILNDIVFLKKYDIHKKKEAVVKNLYLKTKTKFNK